MKLFKRMIFVLGGGCLAVLLILTVIMVSGIAENRKAVNGTVSDFHSNFLNQSSRNAVLGNSAFLEEKINSYFLLLELLLTNPGKVYSREQLLNIVWGFEYPGDVRTVDVHVRRLREKIEANPSDPHYVYTKWGVGYYYKN